MDISRRQFVILTAAAACTGCASQNTGPASAPKTVDAGPAASYASPGIYDQFRHEGFFIVNEGQKPIALSSDCTHRDCPLKALADHTFSCKCHGSRFGQDGNVLHGPATRPLPRFPTTIDENGHLIVQITGLKFDEE